MSNVFLSHSSLDKPFVRRLAAALLSDGFPVWLDSWALELGDSLLDGVYQGIETSGVVLLVVSKASVESGWVSKELNAALVREEQLGRKFLIPIRVDDTPVPLKVADRLYADFTGSFSAPLSALSNRLEKLGCRELQFAADRELICLSFTDGVHPDVASLSQAIDRIARRRGKVDLKPTQIVSNDDSRYTALFKKMHDRVDRVTEDPYYSPAFERIIKLDLAEVRENERRIALGTSMLLGNGARAESIFWYASMLKARNAHTLWSAQLPGSTETFGKSWYCGFLRGDDAACEFFGVPAVERVQVWDSAEAHSTSIFSLWIAASKVRLRDEDGVYIGSSTIGRVCGEEGPRQKFLLPQLLAEHLIVGTGPMIWDLENAMIGVT
jgi:hypothetical protein